MKIYTKTGDQGQTGLFGGKRILKSDIRVQAYGEVDEFNSLIGVVRSFLVDPEVSQLLHQIQEDLFRLGSELASHPEKSVDLGIDLIEENEVQALEYAIDTYEAHLPAMKHFILPGGSQSSAFLHLARTVCRRAERTLVLLNQQESVRSELIRYLNRSSDLMFVLARYANKQDGQEDIPWMGRSGE